MTSTFAYALRRLIPACCLTLTGGCSLDLEELFDELEEIEINIGNSVETVQIEDPRTAPLPPPLIEQEETVVINQQVVVIVDISEQLVIEELPDITILGFENITGYDIFIRYYADGEYQAVLVFDNETLLLEYPCLDSIELISEEDFDIFTGEFVDEFDLSDIDFINPFDFECGEALIITIDPFAVVSDTERIDLVP